MVRGRDLLAERLHLRVAFAFGGRDVRLQLVTLRAQFPLRLLNPRFRSLHDDPRWGAFLEKMGLQD